MPLQPIRLFGDPVLRTPAAPVETFDKELRTLVADLTDTMMDAPGVGLAAPQIGVSLRVFTYWVDDVVGHLINPSLDLSDEEELGEEGCLSLPGLTYDTMRALRVVATGMNMHGEPVVIEGSELLARCVQHETDHLDGILFIDRLDTVARKAAMKEIRESEWFGAPAPVVPVQPALPAPGSGLMRVLFAGTPEAAVPSLRAVLASPHEVVAVLTRPDAPAGRGRRMMPSPVAEIALEEGIEVLRPVRAGDPEFLDGWPRSPRRRSDRRLRRPDPARCPGRPTHGWVNLHFSLLPAWRGAAPVQHAVMAGDEVTGASTFRLEEGLDTGPVFGVVTDTISPTDTAGDLLARLAVAGAGLLVATLDGLEAGALVPVPQAPDGVSLAPKIRVEDARVSWTDPAMRVDRLIRGCTPAPGAWSEFRGERIKLGPVRPAPEVVDLPPVRSACSRTASGSAPRPTRFSSARSRPRGRS